MEFSRSRRFDGTAHFNTLSLWAGFRQGSGLRRPLERGSAVKKYIRRRYPEPIPPIGEPPKPRCQQCDSPYTGIRNYVEGPCDCGCGMQLCDDSFHDPTVCGPCGVRKAMNGQIVWPTKEEIAGMEIDRLRSETHKASDAVVRWHGMIGHTPNKSESAEKVYLHYRDVLEQMINELAERAQTWLRRYQESLDDLSKQVARAEEAEAERDDLKEAFIQMERRP